MDAGDVVTVGEGEMGGAVVGSIGSTDCVVTASIVAGNDVTRATDTHPIADAVAFAHSPATPPRGEWVTFDPPERCRVYHYPDNKAFVYHNVTRLKVSASGNHYLETSDGHHAIVAPGWRVIELDIDDWTR